MNLTSSLTSLCCQLLKLNQFACFMIKDVGPEWRDSQPRFEIIVTVKRRSGLAIKQ